jgi:hypothetical protein
VTVVCEKCGFELKCPTFDEAFAKGYWNTTMENMKGAAVE